MGRGSFTIFFALLFVQKFWLGLILSIVKQGAWTCRCDLDFIYLCSKVLETKFPALLLEKQIPVICVYFLAWILYAL